MQHWLSGYATWHAKRNRRTGHLYQGRYKVVLVEDAGYYWTLSRYIHLNPCSGVKPLVEDSESWPYSSFGGYARKSKRFDWVQYDQLHAYWKASVGGKDPDRAYRHYVKQGLEAPVDPFKHELRQWVFGSEGILRRMLLLAEGADEKKHRATSRRLKSVSAQEVVEATAKVHDVKASDYAKFRSSVAGRDMAAWLYRQWTGTGLEGFSVFFGVAGTGSVSNLVRRAEQRRQQSKDWTTRHVKVERLLGLNTQHKA